MAHARRTFLKYISLVGGAVSATLLGIPVIRSFVSPAFRRLRHEVWVEIGPIDDLEIALAVRKEFPLTVTDAWFERRVITSVWYYSDDGENYNVYNGACTHLACAFGLDNDGSVFLCPCHRGVYEIASGAVLEGPPPRPLDTMATRVDNGILFAKLEVFRPGISDKVAI